MKIVRRLKKLTMLVMIMCGGLAFGGSESVSAKEMVHSIAVSLQLNRLINACSSQVSLGDRPSHLREQICTCIGRNLVKKVGATELKLVADFYLDLPSAALTSDNTENEPLFEFEEDLATQCLKLPSYNMKQ